MKVVIVLSAVLAVAFAKPGVFSPVVTKFHSQDGLGEYHFGYSDGLTAKQELRTADGVTRGAYNYVDAEGKIQSVAYTADAFNGFRVGATNLPKPIENIEPIVPLVAPVETPEVVAARLDHLREFDLKKEELTPVVDVRATIGEIEVERLREAEREDVRRFEEERRREEERRIEERRTEELRLIDLVRDTDRFHKDRWEEARRMEERRFDEHVMEERRVYGELVRGNPVVFNRPWDFTRTVVPTYPIHTPYVVRDW